MLQPIWLKGGPDYGGSRDFTKIRYLEGIGNLDRLIKEACSKTAMNVSGIASLYYAV